VPAEIEFVCVWEFSHGSQSNFISLSDSSAISVQIDANKFIQNQIQFETIDSASSRQSEHTRMPSFHPVLPPVDM
jgi:hypothetical protein